VISDVFAARKAEGRAALIPYVTAGYPERGSTVEVLEALADHGADIIELGIPFSDPLADGPTIQKSSFVSLENGTTVGRVLEDLATFRQRRDTPIVLFTYLNPVIRYGLTAFLAAAEQAGASGLLLTDLPTGSDPKLEDEVIASPLDLVRLVAPTTPLERVPTVARGGSGFLYYISRTGVTGARTELREELAEEVGAIQSVVHLPVAVGFGISSPEQAAFVARVADGVVVGSALVRILGESGVSAAAEFVASLRQAMDE
jgi:tryptophan synthase alpha chain